MIREVLKNKLFISIIIIFIYILILSIGYAFFSKSLSIHGVASTVDYYEGTKLPLTAVIRDTTNNRYYTASNTKSKVDFDSETWQGDTYTLNFEKKFGLVAGSRTIDYVVTFTNPTLLNITDGTITTEITKNDNSRLKSTTGTLSKTEVGPGESVDVVFTIEFNFLSELGEHIAKATVEYTLQNKKRYFYFIVRYFNQ